MFTRRETPGLWYGLAATIAAAWTLMLAAVLAHPLFVTNDSLSNYAHTWFISERITSGHPLPYRFPALGHGDALAYPYAFLPWTTAALLRPILGDWATTLWLVTGVVLLVGATFFALPEARRPLPAALVLANPVLVEVLVLGQLPFAWAAAGLFVAIGCWRRGWFVAAVLVAGLAQATHPSLLLPLTGLLVAWWWLRHEQRRRRLALAYVLSLVIAVPGVALVFLAPVVEDAGIASALLNLFETAGLRAFVVVVPIGVACLGPRLTPARLGTAAVVVLLLNPLLIPLRDTSFAWGAFTRTPDRSLEPFLASSAFEPGATYRLLRVADGKVGMFQLIQAGGKLDSEFFPESIGRRSWADEEAYTGFLQRRKVEYVLIYDAYTRRYHTNERQLLDTLATSGCAASSPVEGGATLFHILCRSSAHE